VKVAFFTYPAAFQNVGGGEIQLLRTRDALRRRGLEPTLFDPWTMRVEDFDVLHVFSSVKDCLGLAETAKARGVKVVVSPVLWSDFRRAVHTDGGLRAKADLFARHAAKLLFPRFPSGRRRLLGIADLVFPNSEAEKRQIARLFAIDPGKIRVVSNGVDPQFADADPEVFRRLHGDEPFVLGVGRIEPRKNQLNLIKALKGSGKRLVLIGSPVSGYERYAEACRREGEGFTAFLPALEHSDPLLKSAYAACSLFVLQGWFETPGLAALEAGLAGARLVVTQGGSTREYFTDLADYLDPASTADIRAKISANFGKPAPAGLKARILERYTWDRVAETYIRLYGELGGRV
jgi:glycosyltransferase involved in cell wall biosynthesis